MASYTSFLNLEKPTTSERLDVLKINSNWDKIDAGVSALNSQLSNLVRAGSVSGTTDSTGDINVQLSASSYIPVAFKVTGGNMPTTAPRMFFQTSQGTGWFIKFINDSTLQNITNTTVEGTIYYLPI